MAEHTQICGHDARSPPPVGRPEKQTKLVTLLGNFHLLYKQFPELCFNDQHVPSQGPSEKQHRGDKTDSISKDIFTTEAPPLADVDSSLSHSVWDSPPATLPPPTPKLGRLDKLDRLGYLHKGSEKQTPLRLNNDSKSADLAELKAHLQSSLRVSSRSARLQKAYGLSIHDLAGRDTSSTAVEPESPLEADEGSANDLVSKATTPATSPDFTFELQAKIDAIVNKSGDSGAGHDIKITFPTGGYKPQGPIPQILQHSNDFVLPSNFSQFQEKARKHRSRISLLVATHAEALGQAITLPWDEDGNYTIVESSSHQRVGFSYGSKSSCIIEPHYRVDKDTQLGIIKARLARMELQRQLDQANATAERVQNPAQVFRPKLVDKSTQPIHVFVDMSNIVIGFYDSMRQERNLLPQQRIQASFFFEALATILERERPCVKRIVAGSMGPGAPWADHMFDAQSSGYTMHILQRVKGPKPSKLAAAMGLGQATAAAAAVAASSASPSMLSPQNGWNVHHEQGVDELLQLHMLQSIVDTPTPLHHQSGQALPPGTMVLATGDGAEAEFSDGFFNHVLRALKHGWCVEVVGFRHNMNQVWDEQAIPPVWRSQFRIIFLDDFAEELLASFH